MASFGLYFHDVWLLVDGPDDTGSEWAVELRYDTSQPLEIVLLVFEDEQDDDPVLYRIPRALLAEGLVRYVSRGQYEISPHERGLYLAAHMGAVVDCWLAPIVNVDWLVRTSYSLVPPAFEALFEHDLDAEWEQVSGRIAPDGSWVGEPEVNRDQ